MVAADDEAGLAALVQVSEEVFGRSQAELGASIRQQQLVDPASIAVVLAVADGQPISSARTEFHAGTDFASLVGRGHRCRSGAIEVSTARPSPIGPGRRGGAATPTSGSTPCRPASRS